MVNVWVTQYRAKTGAGGGISLPAKFEPAISTVLNDITAAQNIALNADCSIVQIFAVGQVHIRFDGTATTDHEPVAANVPTDRIVEPGANANISIIAG